MTAVHFGAGNIGRGFIGLALHEAGHRVIFVDVSDDLINKIQTADSYMVRETGTNPVVHTVTNFDGINSAKDPDAVVAAIVSADIVTTAVGPRILPFVAPLIASGLKQKTAAKPLAVMACENAIGATDTLREEVSKTASKDDLAKARFANTAVDRIIPLQGASDGLDVVVESFSEWAIESAPFEGEPPVIPGAHFVDDLSPYIERKLFTVNTAHASLAYLGTQKGLKTISEALGKPEIRAIVDGVLSETGEILIARHSFPKQVQDDYIRVTLERFQNPDLDDLLERVGRGPLRKLSRHERLIGPAAFRAEKGLASPNLMTVVRDALRFDVPADEESVKLQEMRKALTPVEFADSVCGIEAGHPLFEELLPAIEQSIG